MSLEIALHNGLRHIELFNPDHVKEFLEKDRIFHIYGKVRSGIVASTLGWSNEGRDPKGMQPHLLLSYQQECRDFFDGLYDASLGIRVIDPEDKGADEAVIKEASEAIVRAKFVYILGYGFDENNSERLGLNNSLRDGRNFNKCVHFTNFEDNNRVNKRASKIFYKRLNGISPGGSLVFPHKNERPGDPLLLRT
jgi:hypothetical protein